MSASRPPLFIVCANPACRAVKEVRTPYEQRRRKFCSRRCHGVIHARQHITRAARRRGADTSKRVRRQAAMRRLTGMTPVEIYRMAFSCGWKAGVRAERRRRA